MKKKLSILMLGAMVLGLLCGCGDDNNVTNSTVSILKDGKILSTDVEDFSSDYSQSELDTYVDDEIQTFISENADASIKKKSLSVAENIAKLTLEYDSYKTYTDFNDIELFVGTVAEAKAAGYQFDVIFASVNKGTVAGQAASSDFTDDMKVVIYKGMSDLKVKGTILYASSKNVTLVSKNTISIKDGTSLLNMEEETETTEATETTEGTEISEGETSNTEAEEEAMVFDFPEEVEEEVSEFTSVYTYVIYK